MADRKEQEELKELISKANKSDYPGFEGVVYTIVKHVSRSGMSRVIDCFVVIKPGVPFRISASVAEVLERKYDHIHGGVKSQGAGMDMCFELVYALAQKLYGDGYALKAVDL